MSQLITVFDKKIGNEREITQRQWDFFKASQPDRFTLKGEAPQPAKKKDVAPVDHEEVDFKSVEDIEDLQKEYLKLSGKKKVDQRWGEERLQEEIEKIKK